jgi:hypothetical protein
MYPWTDIEARQLEHRQRVQRVEQTYWMLGELRSEAVTDRWHWRVMNKLGGWLVELGCRLQTHVERAQQVVHAPHMAMETSLDSSHSHVRRGAVK